MFNVTREEHSSVFNVSLHEERGELDIATCADASGSASKEGSEAS
jgi:hypothetical protein